MIQLILTLKMTTAQVVETSGHCQQNSPIQDYVHPDDHTQPSYEMTPGIKPLTMMIMLMTMSIARIKISVHHIINGTR